MTEEDAYFLSRGGYRVEQGRVFDKDSTQPLSQEDITFALEAARSKVRLKALMELNLVLNRYGPSEKLSPEDLASVRRICRENWGVWTRDTRETLKQYFSLRELQDMPSLTGGKAAAPTATGTAAPAPSSQERGRPPLAGGPAAPLPPPFPLTPLGLAQKAAPAAAPSSMKDEPPPLPDEAELSAAVGDAHPQAPPQAPPAPPVQVPQAAPAAAPLAVQSEPAPVPAPPSAAPPAAVPSAAMPAVPVIPAQAVAVDSQAFASFLETAPYGRDVKPLLALLSLHAREPERGTALGVVLGQLPHITLDSTRCGARTRHALLDAGEPRRQIALNDLPLLVERRHLLAKTAAWLPDSPRYYSDRAMPPPRLDALPREAPSEKEERTDRGLTRIYKDGSMRLRLSQEQLASELLVALLDLDGILRGWEPGLHTRLRSEAARFRFLRSYAKDTGKSPELDRELRAGLGEWIERPEDRIDLLLQLDASEAERAALELTALESAGVLEEQAASAFRKTLPASKAEAPAVRTGSPAAREAWLATESAARSEQ
ncbi:MAG: hypothetical protein AAB412_00830 [Elusimicrobiota bacterium]